MLGGFSVGKTSLVRRYVRSIFSEAYLTMVGVKIDKKTMQLPDRVVSLILWELAGHVVSAHTPMKEMCRADLAVMIEGKYVTPA